MKKYVHLLSILFLLSVLILSVFPSGKKEGAKSKDTTLEIAAMAGWANVKPVWAAAEEFTQKTGGNWRLHEFPAAEFGNKQLMELSEKTGAFDLVDAASSNCLNFQDYMMPLNDFIKKDYGSVEAWKKKFSQGVVDLVSKGDQILYWPFHANGQFCVYRKQLFEDPKEKAAFKAKYGYELETPKTWDQLVDVAEFFRRPEKDMWGFHFMGKGNPGGFVLISAFLTEGLKLADFNARTAPFKDPGPARDLALKILTRFDDLRKKDLIPPGVSGMAHMESVEFYKAGKAAISFGWWGDHMGKLRAPEVVSEIGETGTFQFPSSNPDAGVFLSIHTYGIVATADNPELAWEFLKFIGSKDIQLAMSEATGQASPEIEYTNEGIKQGFIPAAMSGLIPTGIILGSPREITPVVTIYRRYASDFFAGNHTPEQYLEFLVKETEKALR
jgi:multiple sugar transport system substrate-binding protein